MMETVYSAHGSDALRDVSLLAKDQYMREVRETRPLTEEEEARLLAVVKHTWQQRSHTDPARESWVLAKQARDRLVEGYQPLIIHLAKRLSRCCVGMEMLDLVHEGNLGLLCTLERVQDLDGVVPFRASALAAIRGTMLAALGDRNGLVRISQRMQQHLRLLEQTEQQLMMVVGREPSYSALAEALHVSKERISELMAYRQRQQVSSLEGLFHEGNAVECGDFASLFVSGDRDDEAHREHLHEVLAHLVTTVLTERQRLVIQLRYGIGDLGGKCHSQGEVAELLGLTKQGVQFHEAAAKERLAMRLQVERVRGVVHCSPVQEDDYTCKEVMGVLGWSEQKVYHHAKAGYLPSRLPEGRKRGMVFPKPIIDALRTSQAVPDDAFVVTTVEREEVG